MKRATDSKTDRGPDLRVTEMTLIGSLAALAALGAVVLTIVWAASLIRGPSGTPTDAEPSPTAPPIAGQERGEGTEPRDREPLVETSEVFASRDPFGPLDSGSGRAGSSGSDGTSQPSWARVVELVAARRGGAQVTIDGRSFSVTQGQRFARHFRLLYVASDCAEILFGDDQFSICEGESILK